MSVSRHLLILVLPTVVLASESPLHVIKLANGDSLQGELQTLAADGGMVIRHEAAPQPLRWRAEALRSLTAHPSVLLEAPPDPVWISLRGGDRFPATIESFDGRHLVSETSWGGRFSVPWEQVAALEFTGGPGAVLFSGPASDQGWVFRNQGGGGGGPLWELADNGISGGHEGGAAVDAQLPDRVEIELEFSWADNLNIGMGIYADSFLPADEGGDAPDEHAPQDEPIPVEEKKKGGENAALTVFEANGRSENLLPHRQCIGLDLSNRRISLQVHTVEDGRDSIGHARLDASVYHTRQMRLLTRVDRVKQVVAVWVDGELVEQWDNVGPFPGNGRALSFWQYHDNGRVEIKRLVVRAWDGQVPEPAPKPRKDKTVLVLADGTRVSGQVDKLEGDEWRLTTDLGEMSLPDADMRHLVAPDTPSEGDDTAPYRVVMAGGHRLNLDAAEIANGRVAARHGVLGDCAFDLALVQRLVVDAKGGEEQP